MTAPLLKVAILVSALLACMSRACAGKTPFAEGSSLTGNATDVARVQPALAAVGDWYKLQRKSASVIVEKGDSDPLICKGQSVSIQVDLQKTSQSGSTASMTYSYSSVFVEYRKLTFRDCNAEEQADRQTSSFNSFVYPRFCCSDNFILSGYDEGTFTISLDSQGLAHAKAKTARIPLYQDSSSSSSGGGQGPTATAVVDLKVNCVTLNESNTTTSTDSCVNGECVIINGKSSSVRCTSRYGDTTVSGTVKLQGAVQLQANLSSPPPGYTVLGRVGWSTESKVLK